MLSLKILLVEDSQSDIEACAGTIKRYQIQKGTNIDCIFVRTREEAISVLDQSFDGAIVDIKLADDGTEGNDVIGEIHAKCRIPVAVLTGTPENTSIICTYIGCFKKGQTGYDEIFDKFLEVKKTGITRILGGTGLIEEAMTKIFWDHFLPDLEAWKKYCANGIGTEKPILRMVLNHLHELLEDDDNASCPEEMYIIPPIAKTIKTGSIIARKSDQKKYVVMSPACDLVVRAGGSFKTDKVQIVEIISFNDVRDVLLTGIVNAEKRKKRLVELLKNNYAEYYHWLPGTTRYSGALINFRYTESISRGNITTDYDPPEAQLSAPFVKDVIARFSAFYARQGQPDFAFEDLAANLVGP